MKRTPPGRAPPTRRARSAPHHSNNQGSGNSGVNNGENYDADESDSNGEDLSTEYHHVALQVRLSPFALLNIGAIANPVIFFLCLSFLT